VALVGGVTVPSPLVLRVDRSGYACEGVFGREGDLYVKSGYRRSFPIANLDANLQPHPNKLKAPQRVAVRRTHHSPLQPPYCSVALAMLLSCQPLVG
jgi:hypothetical protein